VSENSTTASNAVLAALASMSWLELLAVVLGITYLLLAMKESLWCWYAAFIASAIFLYLFWQVDLVMETALQVYYLAMAVYGWWHWRSGASRTDSLPVSRWEASQHGYALAAVAVATLVSGWLLQEHTSAALPYLDSFTTWGSILTTWMVARKILENWLYWLVIDAVSIYLYIDRELYLTALLFAAYLIIVIFGYWKWLQHYRAQSR
jgi:nicotinamide mononucleotide transporter